MNVVIIDSGGANIGSVTFALARLGVAAELSRDPARIAGASHVILPGVGAAADAMDRLRSSGLDILIPQLAQPVLGICLGMQLLFAHSEEGDSRCLGVFPRTATRLLDQPGMPVPHMGWNTLEVVRSIPLLDGIDGEHCYFVHGYAVSQSEHAAAVTEYGTRFVSVVSRDNFHAAQFHPERSAGAGARLLANFLELDL